MNAIIVLLLILFITLIGYSVIVGLHLLDVENKLFTISIAYGLGVGLIATQLFIYSRLNIPWQTSFLISPWIFVIGIFCLKHVKQFSVGKLPSLGKIDIALLIAILISCSYTFFEALIRPASTWDALATWLFESKVFFIDGKIIPSVFNYIHSDYPLIVKLLGTFVYVVLGRVDDTAVLLLSFSFYIFLALLLFAKLKEKFSIRYALLFTFLFVTMQNFIRHGGRMEAGLADLPLGYFVFISFSLLINYLQRSSAKNFLILNIFLGVTMLIKFEGMLMTALIGSCALYHIYKRKLYKHLPFLFFWIVPYIDWQIYRRVSGVHSVYLVGHGFEMSIAKTINAFAGTFKELVNVRSWNVLWITYFYSVLFLRVKKNLELSILNFLIFSQLSLYMLIYLFTAGHAPESSIERLLIHLAPLAFYYITIVTHMLLNNFYKVILKTYFPPR